MIVINSKCVYSNIGLDEMFNIVENTEENCRRKYNANVGLMKFI